MSLHPALETLLVCGLIFILAALLLIGLLRRARRARQSGDTIPPLPSLAVVSMSPPRLSEPAPTRRYSFLSRAIRPGRAARPFQAAAPTTLTLHVELDAQLCSRITEFLNRPEAPADETGARQNRGIDETSDGCIVMLTEAAPPALGPTLGALPLSGASAALSLARALAESPECGFTTLLIDMGSPAWSVYEVPPRRSSEEEDLFEDDREAEGMSGGEPPGEPAGDLPAAPDVLPLPDEAAGVYDVAAGHSSLDGCLLAEEESPRLMALPPGEMPSDWPAIAVSDGMRRLLAAARGVAEVTLLYAPRAAEYPEQARRLAGWSDGIILIGADLGKGRGQDERDRRRDAAEYERTVQRLLSGDLSHPAPAPLLGRMALDFASAPAAQAPARVVQDSAAE